jgi:hypothetical protein
MAERLVRNHPLMVSQYQATVKCRDCEIFIGVGHEDNVPLPAPDGLGYMCRPCWQSFRRRTRSTDYLPTRTLLRPLRSPSLDGTAEWRPRGRPVP